MVIITKNHFIYISYILEIYFKETRCSRDTIFHHIVAWHYLLTSEVLDKGQVRRINNWDLATESQGKFQAHMEMLQHDTTAKEYDTLKDGPSGHEKTVLFLSHDGFPVWSWKNS